MVEDEIAVRTLVRAVLEREGCDVLCADDAEAALELVSEQGGGIDLLVTDLLLPGGSAATLVGDLARMGVTMPVLYISGYNEPLSPLPGTRSLFLSKPFDLVSLWASVQALLAD